MSSLYYVDGAATSEFAHMMHKVAEALGAKITEEQVRLHAQILGDIPLHDLKMAFRRAATELEAGYYPTPGKIRSFLGPSTTDAALLAWTALGRAASDHGAYTSVEIDDGAAAEAVEAVWGSWPAFCAQEDGPALGAKRQEFMAVYREVRRRQPPARRLSGLCESSGQYPTGSALVWVARVSADWRVTAEREQPKLTAPATPKAIE